MHPLTFVLKKTDILLSTKRNGFLNFCASVILDEEFSRIRF